MVRDHQFGMFGLACRFLDVTFAEMRTSRIEAFTAPVGKSCYTARAKMAAQPAGEIPANHITVAGEARPTHHKADEQPVLLPARASLRAHHHCAQGFLDIEKAGVILPPLPDHRAFGLDARVGVEARQFLIKLAL